MKTLFQIVINHQATKFVFTDRLELIDKMIELQKSFITDTVTFLIIEL